LGEQDSRRDGLKPALGLWDATAISIGAIMCVSNDMNDKVLNKLDKLGVDEPVNFYLSFSL